MDSGGKQPGSSSSSSSSTYSLVTDLFGPKGSSPSSSTYSLASDLFGPNNLSKVTGRDALGLDAGGKKQDNFSQGREVEAKNEYKSFDGKVGEAQHVCNLSSSIYYGGQDMYIPQGSQSSTSVTHKKDWGEEYTHSTTTGNLWEGSVYY